MANYIVFCTVPNEFNANLIATSIIEDRLAACVNIIPGVTSVYTWEGITQTETELMLNIKTTDAKFEALKNKIIELHENSLPEIVAVPIEAGYEEYLNWVNKVTL